MIDFLNSKSIRTPRGEVASITRNGETLWQKVKYKRELAYLESTGKQYIDTGIVGDRDCGVELEVYITGNLNNGCGVGSWGANTSTERAWLFYVFGNTFRCGYGSTNAALSYGAELNTWYKWKIDVVDDKQVIYLNDEHINTSGAKDYFTTNLNLYLFGMNNRGSFAYELRSKMRYVKIRKLGVLVRDFIPVLDMNDRPCMYDKISEEFFYNQGTGEFLYA